MLIKSSLVETVIQRPWFSPEDLDLGDLQTPEALERDVLVVTWSNRFLKVHQSPHSPRLCFLCFIILNI